MRAFAPDALRPWLVLLAGLALAGCSGDDETSATTTTGGAKTSVTQTVGPEGGTIVLDGATVTFPAGALATATSITIAATDEAAPAGHTALSPIFECAPSGLAFEPKVTMAMKFVADGTTPTMFWSSGADPTFTDVGGSVEGDVMSAGVAHFSRGFVGHAP